MRLRIIALLVTLALGIVVGPLAADAQQPTKVFRIGYLSPTGPGPLLDAFRQALRELGWIEGQNIIIEERYAKGRAEPLPDLAANLVRLKVDVIFATSTVAVLAAKKATATIPIVMRSTVDPVEAGFVASLARPGGNITGLVNFEPELHGKQLELLKEAVPTVTQVAVLRNPVSKAAASHLKETRAAARALGQQLQVLDVRGPEEFESAFSAMIKERSGALSVLVDPLFWSHLQRIADLATKSRLPAVYQRREFAEAGGLMSYGANLRDAFRRAATYVDKVLKGAKAADLPVEQATKFELVINLKTAKALGITIPQSVLIRADEVIQ